MLDFLEFMEGLMIYMVFLYVAPVLLSIVYKYFEYMGYIDKWTGRFYALDGLKRLELPTGYSKDSKGGWIFNDGIDSQVFFELEKRISKRSECPELKSILATGVRPSCILIGGEPMPIKGVPPEWSQECKYGYLPTASVMYLFGVQRTGNSSGKAVRVCALFELNKWLDKEKEERKFYLEGLILALISASFILLRVQR